MRDELVQNHGKNFLNRSKKLELLNRQWQRKQKSKKYKKNCNKKKT